MTAHTPGPWRVSNRAGSGYGKEFMVYTPKGAAFIGDQLAPDGVSIAEARANASLAACAPDFLDALKAIASCIPHHPGDLVSIAKDAVANFEGKA